MLIPPLPLAHTRARTTWNFLTAAHTHKDPHTGISHALVNVTGWEKKKNTTEELTHLHVHTHTRTPSSTALIRQAVNRIC